LYTLCSVVDSDLPRDLCIPMDDEAKWLGGGKVEAWEDIGLICA